MENLIFILLFLVGALVPYLLLRASGYGVMKIDMVSITFLFIMMFGYVGIPILYFGLDEYRLFGLGINDRGLLLRLLIYSILSLLLFALSVLTTTHFLESILRIKKRSSRLLSINLVNRRFLVFGWLCLSVSFAGFLIYINQVSSLAILTVVNDAESIKEARSLMKNEFSGPYFIYSILMHDFAYIASYAFIIYLKLKERRGSAVIGLMLAFLLSTFTSLQTTEKTPFVWYLFSLIVLVSILSGYRRLPLKKVFAFAVLALLIMVAFFIYFMGVDNAHLAVKKAISRAFAGSISPAYFYLEIFPSYKDFLMGVTFPNPLGILPYEPINITIFVANYMFGSSELFVSTAPTIYWAEMYANFGISGIIFSSILVGFFLSALEKTFKLKLNIYYLPLYLVLILHFKDLSITGLSMFIVNFYLVILCVFYLLMLSVSSFFIKKL